MVEYSNLFVVLMGMGVVFFGLICIILLTMLMGIILRPKESRKAVENQTGIREAELPEEPQRGIKPEILAVITSVLSEEVGTTPYGLNIVDIERL